MCLAIPGKIVELDDEDAVIEIQGIRRQGNVSLIDDPQVGNYVLLHAGFAIHKWSEADVREYNEVMDGIADARKQDDEEAH